MVRSTPTSGHTDAGKHLSHKTSTLSRDTMMTIRDSMRPKTKPIKRDLSIKIEPAGTVVIMALDASSHSYYCLHYYIRHIHKKENLIHVCYVKNDLMRKNHRRDDATTNTGDAEGKEVKQRSGCFGFLSFFCPFYRPNSSKKPMTRIESIGPSPGVFMELERQDRANCHLVKMEIQDVFKSNNITGWDFKKIKGEDPWTAIVDYSKEKQASLIVIGSRGLNKLQRSLLSSVSTKVLNKSHIPVLVVKRPVGLSTTLFNAGTILE